MSPRYHERNRRARVKPTQSRNERLQRHLDTAQQGQYSSGKGDEESTKDQSPTSARLQDQCDPAVTTTKHTSATQVNTNNKVQSFQSKRKPLSQVQRNKRTGPLSRLQTAARSDCSTTVGAKASPPKLRRSARIAATKAQKTNKSTQKSQPNHQVTVKKSQHPKPKSPSNKSIEIQQAAFAVGRDSSHDHAQKAVVYDHPHSRVIDWLSKLDTSHDLANIQIPEDIAFQMPPFTNQVLSGRNSLVFGTITNDTPELLTFGEGSTPGITIASAKTKRIPTQQLIKLLNSHNVDEKDTKSDPVFDKLGLTKLLENAVHVMDIESLKSYHSVLRRHSDAIRRYETAQNDLNQWLPPNSDHRRWPAVTEVDFQLDRENCMHSNEADFQKTNLMSLIDRHDFRDHFAFASEYMWAIPDQYHLPLHRPSTVKLPSVRSDMVICFSEEALEVDRWLTFQFPEHFLPCLYPGRDKTGKIVPFLLIEAKKSQKELEDAFVKNIMTASQALYNIYILVSSYPDLVKQFFEEVRVFSIDVNAQDIALRVHRATYIESSSSCLGFQHHKLKTYSSYTRLEGCHIFKTLLLDYALKTLLPIIQDVFKRLCRDKPPLILAPSNNQGTKRKQEANETAIQGDVQPGVIASAVLDDNPLAGGNQTPQGTSPARSFGSKVDVQDMPLPASSRKKARNTKRQPKGKQ